MKYIKILLLSFFLFHLLHGASLVDDFENNTRNNWQNSPGLLSPPSSPNNTTVLELAHKAYTYKTYNFSVASANANVTLDIDFYAVGKWKSTDKLAIYFNGGFQYYASIPGTDGNTNVVPYHFTFPATLDANGLITVYFYVQSNTTSKKGYIDNVRLNTGKDPSYRDFSLRYQQTFKGDMYTIGNTVLVTPKIQNNTICNTYTNGPQLSPITKSNDNYYLCAYWADPTLTFPTTTAVLPRPSTGAKVKWAGLYWQALLDRNTTITPNSAMSIKLKHSAMANYISVSPTTLDQKVAAAGIPGYLSYAAFADVTKYFVDNNLTSGTISVGDIPVVEGKIAQLGTYGAWSLVVIYEDANSTLKNFSVYDGWQKVDQFNTLVNIDIGGFHTPKNQANVAASLSVFTAEGDKYIPGDALQVKPLKQTGFTTLLNNFDSTIDTNTTRTPNPSNNQGIDIRTFELGTAGKNIIASEESNLTLQFTSSLTTNAEGNPAQDAYWPSLVTFAAELYTPRICYDYTASIGDQIPIPTKGTREINSSTFGGGLPLKVQFLIHSYEADFTYIHSKAYLTFTGADAPNLTYNNLYTEMSPANKNSYYKYINHPELEVNGTLGQVALGTNVVGVIPNNGGDLTTQATTYAILGYDLNTSNDTINTKFDLHFDAQIIFNPGDAPVNYTFDTAANNIPRCETNATYDPIRQGLNIERTNTENEPAETKYTLTTQITGRPYTVDIVSYTNDGIATIAAQQKLDTTVELELINADQFQNSSSAGYDTTCQNPAPIGKGKLIYLDPNTQDPLHPGRHPVSIPADTQGFIDNDIALHNAAFRVWVLAKTDNTGRKTVLKHTCTNTDTTNSCFMNLYDTQIFADVNQSQYCNTECHDAATKNNTQCYTCLKDYYAVAICSSDNFSIRPESFTVTLKDDNNYDTSVLAPRLLTSNINPPTQKLAAGYQYLLEVNATNYSSSTRSIGYYSDRYAKYNYPFGTIPPYYKPTGALAINEFSPSNPTACADRNSTSLPYHFVNGILTGTAHIVLNNVGTYNLWFSDSQWTEVDQLSYPYKPVFGGIKVPDCDENSTSTSAASRASTGCTISSVFGNKQKIPMRVMPYRFDISTIALIKHPNNGKNYMYLNDLNTTTYYNPNGPIIDMAIAFEGNITARSLDNYRLSNFTDSCVADDITLKVTLNDINDTLMPFQQFLQQTSPVSRFVDTQLGLDKNVTLPKAAFLDNNATTSPGKATLYLSTTFKKPLNTPVNPFIASYKTLNAIDTNVSVMYDINLTTGIRPDGNQTYDQNITYYFAKVTPLRRIYANVSANYKQTPLYIDIYCDGIGITCSDFDLNQTTQSPDELTTWYDASNIFDNVNDGTTDLVVTDGNGTVNPSNGIVFDSGAASQTDINVTLTAGAPRPNTITVEIQPVPWLRYHPTKLSGYPEYKVDFTNNGWAGVGNTGSVVETGSSKETLQRTNW